MKRLLSLLLFVISFNIVNANHWTPNPYQFQSNMTVIGVLSFHGEEQRRDSIEVGAFCGDECRGSVITDYDENLDRYYVFMMIYGNHNDSIGFRCYDHKLDMELIMIPESHIMFKANDMIGSVMNPFVFSFQCYQHSVTVDISPESLGSVIGDGIHYRYDTCFLDITPIPRYQLDALTENGDTLTKQEHYSFIVLTDRHFTAHFSEMPIYYQIGTKAEPEDGGSILGGGEYLEGDVCKLTVTVNPGYDYLGLYENEQLVTNETEYSFEAYANRDFIAKFALQINYYQISAEVEPENYGTVSGLGVYEENEVCNLEMIPNVGYYFVALKENGEIISEEPNYSFTVESNRSFVAEFAKHINYYEITAEVSPDNAGSISGLGLYQEFDTCNLEVIEETGYEFVAFKEDGEIISEEPSYSFIVESDRHLTAEFALKEFAISLSANPTEGGTVSGGGTYTYGSTVYAIAIPNDNYIFRNWTDEEGTIITSNPQHVFEVMQNVNMIANFDYVDAVHENDENILVIYPNPADDFVTIENDNLLGNNVVIYDLTGKIVLRKYLYSGENKIDVRNVPDGMYIISVNGVRSKLIIQ